MSLRMAKCFNETDVHWELYQRGYIFVHRYSPLHVVLRKMIVRMAHEGKVKMIRRTGTGWTYVPKKKEQKSEEVWKSGSENDQLAVSAVDSASD